MLIIGTSLRTLLPRGSSFRGAGSIRTFSVKQLNWCAPKESSIKRVVDHPSTKANVIDCVTCEDQSNYTGPDRFGIVAAMSRNRIIGMGGTLPWPKLTEDRAYFKNLTRNKILILGRKTLQENIALKHVSHVRRCIVVSKTLQQQNLQEYPNNFISIAKSFPEALTLAKEYEKKSGDVIDCWIGGGEKIYEEALQHPSAHQVHLTIVDLDVDFKNNNADGKKDIAMFPAKYRWDRNFKCTSVLKSSEESNNSFTTHVYEHKKKETK
jgi:dihydrofolate reductase